MNNGHFLISLDFELFWGVRDTQTKKSYGQNILGVKSAIEKMLVSFELFGIDVTFAIVGFLFHKNKKELLNNLPDLLPNYNNKHLSPYLSFEYEVGSDEQDDPYHFGSSMIEMIRKYPNHEIATHTYCHYYCLEDGQSKKEFEADLVKAIQIASEKGICFSSIIFPRNQTNLEYLKICKHYGIESYRGNEKGIIYSPKSYSHETKLIRFLRLIDSYINLTGFHCYSYKEIKQSFPFNIPSSRFLRPFSNKLSFLEYFKLIRIKNAMTYAAKQNMIYHLWWHPHNFGINLDKNIYMLNQILIHYKFLEKKYNFKSITMRDLSNKLKN